MTATKQDLVRISGKNLGEVALPTFCARCLWLKLRMKFRLPHQRFPGIFSSIDAYTKRMVHAWFDEHGGPPPWLQGIAPIVTYVDPPHHSRFNTVDDKHGVLLTGDPDGMFVLEDSSYLIADYKTARFTKTQDELMPMYVTQLNSYAIIAERCGYGPVSALALAYMEPVTDLFGNHAELYRENGFAMEFSAHLLRVDLDGDLIDRLLGRVRELHDLPEPPQSAPRCKDCSLLERLFEVSNASNG